MKKHSFSFLVTAILILVVGWTYYAIMPQNVQLKDVALSEFSPKRAIEKLEKIAQEPHYVGSKNHPVVADYLVKELKTLGLETEIQEGFSLTKWGNLTKSKNILARIKGSQNGKAVLLLSHYDSAPHSYSLGANDDGVGIVTILESVRAFLHNQTTHTNDIIILFTDAEELGLNGAALFVTEHAWAKDVGVVVNLEARGSSGPSYMLMEATHGNRELLKSFVASEAQFPASNSLMYSIYKLLPNDTDLTIFRENGKIQGFNLAFIDNHFNYHTSQDNLQSVELNTLQHQGSYVTAMLQYFSNSDLARLNSNEDFIYFNTPIGFFTYSFTLIYPLLIISFACFIVFIIIGIAKRILEPKQIFKGFIPILLSVLISGFVGFLGWNLLKLLYPDYNEMLHGFTYNGHAYIWAFSFIALAISFISYKSILSEKQIFNFTIAPIFLWFVINLLLAIYLPGGSFFLLPTLSILIYFGYFVLTQKSSKLLTVVLAIPSIFIIVPFVSMFPIGLGLKMLFGSMILISLTFALLLPLFGQFINKRNWSIIAILIAIGFLAEAHLNSQFEEGKGKPNSLLYILDADQNKAFWSTYDLKIDPWTQHYLGNNPVKENPMKDFALFSKYNSTLQYQSNAPIKEFKKPIIQYTKDTIVGNFRQISLKIIPQRAVNRYDIFANEAVKFHHLKSNGIKFINQKGSLFKRNGSKLLSYYVVEQIPLELQFMVEKNAVLDLKLLESSFDLLDNEQFSIPKRPKNMIAKPFVLTDAIVVKMKIPENILPKIESIAIENE